MERPACWKAGAEWEGRSGMSEGLLGEESHPC